MRADLEDMWPLIENVLLIEAEGNLIALTAPSDGV